MRRKLIPGDASPTQCRVPRKRGYRPVGDELLLSPSQAIFNPRQQAISPTRNGAVSSQDRSSVNAKVVVEQKDLHGSPLDSFPQRVAAVYLDGDEYRVYAPPKAVGDALEWVEHFRVHQPNPENVNSEIPVKGANRTLAIKLLKKELEKMKAGVKRLAGLSPDGSYCDAQICLQGHVRSSEGCFERGERCSKCGAACIDECQYCKTPIRGRLAHSPLQHYDLPFFCHAPNCGLAYPWMQDKLETARELLYDIENLALDERDELWDLLKFVMCDPKSEWAQAKTELACIKLVGASKASRDVLLDFTARVAAQVIKSKF
jgi:hypothetical protein